MIVSLDNDNVVQISTRSGHSTKELCGYALLKKHVSISKGRSHLVWVGNNGVGEGKSRYQECHQVHSRTKAYWGSFH
jgi:hypothetical protein